MTYWFCLMDRMDIVAGPNGTDGGIRMTTKPSHIRLRDSDGGQYAITSSRAISDGDYPLAHTPCNAYIVLIGQAGRRRQFPMWP